MSPGSNGPSSLNYALLRRRNPRLYLMKKAFTALAALLLANGMLWAQLPPSYTEPAEETDPLMLRYLSDTLHADAKIKELVDSARTRPNVPTARSRAIKEFQIALALAPYDSQNPATLAYLHSQFANALYDAGVLELCEHHMRLALTYRRKATPGPSDDAYNLLGKAGSFYLRFQQYDSAAVYYTEAVNEAQALGDSLWIAASLNNLGILYWETNRDEEALRNYRNALAYLRTGFKADSMLLGSINDNLAELFLRQKNWEEAATYYKKNVALYLQWQGHAGWYKALLGTARVAIAKGDFSSARALLKQAEPDALPKDIYLNNENKLRLLEVRKAYFTGINDWKSVATIDIAISALKDSLNNNKKQLLDNLMQALTYSEIYKVRKDIQLNQVLLAQREEDLAVARHTATRNLLIALTTGILAIAVLVLLYLFFRNRNMQQKQQIELQHLNLELSEANLRNQQLEQEKLQKELAYKKRDIGDLGLYLSKLKDLNDTMLDKLAELRNKKPAEQKEAINDMVNELGVMIHSQEKMTMIQENIETVNKEFSEKLIKSFPNLTKSEIELCGLFRMNMSNKEIGLLKNISTESVKMARYRLRKKLNLAPEADLFKFLSYF